MRIFKYTDHHALNLIQDCRVKVSEPYCLNDPFELSPRMDRDSVTLEWAMELGRQEHIINELFAKEGRSRGFTKFADYKSWYLKNLRSIAEKRLPKLQDNVEAMQKTFAETAGTYWRILCASKRSDSILMWSHYAKNHEGAIIELDTGEPKLSTADGEFTIEVKYSKEKAGYVHNVGVSKTDVDQFGRNFLRVAGTKSLDWAYEDEVRLVFAEADCVDNCFVPIVRSAVKSVILGCRSPGIFRAQTLEVLRHEEYAHVIVYQASLSRTKYALEFQQIKR